MIALFDARELALWHIYETTTCNAAFCGAGDKGPVMLVLMMHWNALRAFCIFDFVIVQLEADTASRSFPNACLLQIPRRPFHCDCGLVAVGMAE